MMTCCLECGKCGSILTPHASYLEQSWGVINLGPAEGIKDMFWGITECAVSLIGCFYSCGWRCRSVWLGAADALHEQFVSQALS